MSENVGSSGMMVPLNRKMTEEEREEITEALWESIYTSDVHINYEGTLAYTDERSDGYGITFGTSARTNDLYVMSQALSKHGFDIVPNQGRSYSCYWYNGSDSDMDMMTLENFLKTTGQNG